MINHYLGPFACPDSKKNIKKEYERVRATQAELAAKNTAETDALPQNLMLEETKTVGAIIRNNSKNYQRELTTWKRNNQKETRLL